MCGRDLLQPRCVKRPFSLADRHDSKETNPRHGWSAPPASQPNLYIPFVWTSYVQEAVQASVQIHKEKQKLGSHPVATDIHENGNGSLQNTFVSSPFFNRIILYQGTPIGNLLGQGACIALATLANEACQGESVELSGIGALLINLLLKFQAPQRGIPGITTSIHCKHNAHCTAYTTYCTETRSIVLMWLDMSWSTHNQKKVK